MSDLDIVIINWNRLRETRDAGRRIGAWQRLESQLWIVDNGSEAGEAEVLAAELPAAEVIASPVNLGFGGANNLALARGESEWVLLLNNDAEIDETGVERLIEALEQRPEALCAGPWIDEIAAGREIVKAGGRDIALHAGTHLTADRLSLRRRTAARYEVSYVSGTAALLRRSVLESIGPLDEEYFFGGEMADLCARGRRAGHPSLIVPAARAVHEADRAGRFRSLLYPYYVLRNRFLFIRRQRRGWLPLLLPYWTLRGAVSIVRALLRGETGEARVLREGLLDGVRGRFGGNNERIRSLTAG